MNTAQPRIQLAGILYAAAGMLRFPLIAGAAALGIPLDRPQTAAFYAAEALFSWS